MNTFKSEAQWSDLPQEIRGKILEYVPGRFAGICRDWQNAIEPRNFRVLQVGSDDQSLENLAKILHNKYWRQSYVKHIWFKIELTIASRIVRDVRLMKRSQRTADASPSTS
ncbi:uncharacterized protein CCOS01_12153 [Colletotrichum costaricense]|uniref:F-box domain-containing protein n=1 Tax=Colletotrichum costaricense TaxID=1209916 RepID=A0AAI9YNZ5_9PEZI|nr:uncharacterized protein CCOS01_12153 [Colletotrichum costaricense]KAK1517896.1 hypothetical protein CCOS01_12153 [Colletotrichum costaricense]